MSASDPSSFRSSDRLPDEVDPEQLDSIFEHATSLIESGEGNTEEESVETALTQVEETVREAYRKPLLKRIADALSPQVHPTLDGEPVADLSCDEPMATIDQPQQAEQQQQAPGVDATIDAPAGGRSKVRVAKKKEKKESLPRAIGKFRIVRELGRGAFGVVYLGHDGELGRDVAIKVSLIADEELQERLRVEASKVAGIESNGIVPVYHIGKTEDDKFFIVQKYIEGSTLRGLLKQHGPMSPAAASRLMREIALGLEPAHVNDIVHRDLKPDNVLIGKNGKAWIADFGLAISEDEQQGRGREAAGTPSYMSPEQIKGRIDFIDPRSDIWALGVMYYELLCGRLPFSGKDRRALADQICDLDPRPLQQRAPDHLTEAMDQVFRKCCAKKPADRYATVRDFAADLQGLILAGLSEENIHGQVISSRIGSTIELEHSGMSGVSTRMDTTRHSVSGMSTELTPAPLWKTLAYRIAGAVMIAGLAIAASVASIWLLMGQGFVDQSATPTAATDSDPSSAPGLQADLVTPDFSGDDEDGSPAAGDGSDPPTEDSLEAAVPVDDQLLGLEDADGSEEKPWIVAQSGPASHRTIREALEAGPSDSHIYIKGGLYEEALVITSPVTIECETVGAGNFKELVVVVRNDQESPLTIDVPDGKVTVRYMTIEALGHRMSREFNAINHNGGTFVADECHLRSSSFNCIKVRNNAVLGARFCDFQESREYAISTKDHQSVAVVDCDFRDSGVQLVGGTGSVSNSRFFGSKGVYAEATGAEVTIAGCRFEECGTRGLGVAEGGIVSASDCTFLNCNTAMDVSGGTLKATNAKVQGGTIGAHMTNGTLTLEAASMSGLRWGVGVEGVDQPDAPAPSLVIDQVDFDNCQENGIFMLAGELDLRGGEFVDCGMAILLGNQNKWPDNSATAVIDGAVIRDMTLNGMNIFSGPVTLKDVEISGCDFGLYVNGPNIALAEEPLVQVTLDNPVFTGQRYNSMLARGDCRIVLDNVQRQPEKMFKTLMGAQITLKGPEGEEPGDKKGNKDKEDASKEEEI